MGKHEGRRSLVKTQPLMDKDNFTSKTSERGWCRNFSEAQVAEAFTHLALCALSAAHWYTIPHGIGGGDCGELAANSCSFGVAHPPGYPLLIVISHTWLQVSQFFCNGTAPSLLLHMFNVLIAHMGLQVLASAMRFVLRHGHNEENVWVCEVSVTIGTGFFALTPIVWEFSSTFEVFALNNLLCASLLNLTSRVLLDSGSTESIKFDYREKLVRYGAFICGLALTNQHTAVLFEVPLILFIATYHWLPTFLRRETRLESIRRGFIYAICFGAGLLVYMQSIVSALYIRTQGSWGDPASISGLLRHFLRVDYGTFKLFPGGQASSSAIMDRDQSSIGNPGWVARTALYFEALAFESLPNPGFIILACVGFLSTQLQSRKRPIHRIGFAWGASFIFALFVFHLLSNMPLLKSQPHLGEIRKRFWQQPQLVIGLFIGLGTHTVLRAVANFFSKAWQQHNLRTLSVGFCFTLLAFSVVLSSSFRWALSTGTALRVRSESGVFDQYVRDVLDYVPHGGVLVTRGDMEWSGIQYLQRCEGKRPDVTLVSSDLASMPWYITHLDRYPAPAHIGDMTHQLFDRKKPVAFTGRQEDWDVLGVSSSGSAAIRLIPEGPILVHRPQGSGPAKAYWTDDKISYMHKLVHQFARWNDGTFTGTWEWMVALRMFQRGRKYFETHASLAQAGQVKFHNDSAAANHMLRCARATQLIMSGGLCDWHEVSDQDEQAISDLNVGIMLLRAGELGIRPELISEAMHLFAAASREEQIGRAPRVRGHPSYEFIKKLLASQDIRGGQAYFQKA